MNAPSTTSAKTTDIPSAIATAKSADTPANAFFSSLTFILPPGADLMSSRTARHFNTHFRRDSRISGDVTKGSVLFSEFFHRARQPRREDGIAEGVPPVSVVVAYPLAVRTAVCADEGRTRSLAFVVGAVAYHGRFVDVRHPLEIVVYRAPLPLDVTNFALNPFRQARFDVVEQPAGSKRRRFAIVFRQKVKKQLRWSYHRLQTRLRVCRREGCKSAQAPNPPATLEGPSRRALRFRESQSSPSCLDRGIR